MKMPNNLSEEEKAKLLDIAEDIDGGGTDPNVGYPNFTSPINRLYEAVASIKQKAVEEERAGLVDLHSMIYDAKNGTLAEKNRKWRECIAALNQQSQEENNG